MERLTPVIRISTGLAILTCSILMVLDLVGLVPEMKERELDARLQLCETLAAQATAAGHEADLAGIRSALRFAVRRNPEILSAGLRAENGRLLATSEDHQRLWSPKVEEASTATHVRVPLFRNGEPWATLEVRFEELASGSLVAIFWERPLVRLLVLVGGLGFVAYLAYLRRTLRHLDPSAVIPARVQAALDVMTEGVMLVDDQQRIVLANAALAERLGRSPASLLGVDASSLGWRTADLPAAVGSFPWTVALREGQSSTGTPLRLDTENGESVFVVNGSPVRDGWGRPKGAIATFDDVTELERKRAQLEEALVMLEKSQDEIRLQNEELQVLAKRDPLTGVANRRAFMERFEGLFRSAKETGRKLCCIMADIDHFKAVNDIHGHAAGDEVIRRVAEAMASEVRSTDSVCRYGGEEFCLVLPDAEIEAGARIAQRLNRKVRLPGFARVPITVSFGVSSIEYGAAQLYELIDQADQALYAAKQAGRNRVIRWDEMSRASH